MKPRILASLATLLALGISWQTIAADGILKHHQPSAPPACEPGYQLIAETVYHDVPRTVCKMVPEVKKKWVYSCIEEPFCILDCKGGHCEHGHGKHGHGKHGHCPSCCGPLCRNLLVKKQIEEPCDKLKCVTETIVERVPCVVYKKVPIGSFPTTVVPPAASGSPMIEVIPNAPIKVDAKK